MANVDIINLNHVGVDAEVVGSEVLLTADTMTVIYDAGWPASRPTVPHVIAVGHTSAPSWLTAADVWMGSGDSTTSLRSLWQPEGGTLTVNVREVEHALVAAAWEASGTNVGAVAAHADGVKLSRDGSAAGTYGSLTLDMPVDLTNRQIVVRLQSLDANLTGIWFEMYAPGRTTVAFRDGTTNGTHLGRLAGAPRMLTVDPLQLTDGTRSFAALPDFRRLGIRLYAAAGTTAEVVVSGVYVVDTIRAPGATPLFFDDGKVGNHTYSLPAMTERGLRGIAAIETDKIGTAGYMTTAQIDDLYAAGWDIVSHVTGNSLTGYDLGNVAAALRDSQEVLRSNGWTRGYRHLVYPGGAWNDDVAAIVSRYHESARAVTTWGATGYPITWRMAYDGGTSYYQGVSISSLQTRLTELATNGGMYPVTFHETVASGATGVQNNLADFETILDSIVTNGHYVPLASELFGGHVPEGL